MGLLLVTKVPVSRNKRLHCQGDKGIVSLLIEEFTRPLADSTYRSVCVFPRGQRFCTVVPPFNLFQSLSFVLFCYCRLWMSSCLEAFMRGATFEEKSFVIKKGLLDVSVCLFFLEEETGWISSFDVSFSETQFLVRDVLKTGLRYSGSLQVWYVFAFVGSFHVYFLGVCMCQCVCACVVFCVSMCECYSVCMRM